jgi:hypothetical protein
LPRASKQLPRPRASPVVMADDDGWKSKVFSVENAGPWLILIVVLSFEALATLPREDLPPLVQQLIPLVLGKQYAIPPPQ